MSRGRPGVASRVSGRAGGGAGGWWCGSAGGCRGASGSSIMRWHPGERQRDTAAVTGGWHCTHATRRQHSRGSAARAHGLQASGPSPGRGGDASESERVHSPHPPRAHRGERACLVCRPPEGPSGHSLPMRDRAHTRPRRGKGRRAPEIVGQLLTCDGVRRRSLAMKIPMARIPVVVVVVYTWHATTNVRVRAVAGWRGGQARLGRN